MALPIPSSFSLILHLLSSPFNVHLMGLLMVDDVLEDGATKCQLRFLFRMHGQQILLLLQCWHFQHLELLGALSQQLIEIKPLRQV